MSEVVIARNPDPESALPYLVRLSRSSGAVVLAFRETWPHTANGPSTRTDDRRSQSLAALRHGYDVSDRGTLRPEIWEAFREKRPAN